MTERAEIKPHHVRINFNSTKRYRSFHFLPRKGDRIDITDKETMFHFVVEAVWFDDHYGEHHCDVQLNCRTVEEREIGS